jgi:para-nitrobenzyl esterase
MIFLAGFTGPRVERNASPQPLFHLDGTLVMKADDGLVVDVMVTSSMQNTSIPKRPDRSHAGDQREQELRHDSSLSSVRHSNRLRDDLPRVTLQGAALSERWANSQHSGDENVETMCATLSGEERLNTMSRLLMCVLATGCGSSASSSDAGRDAGERPSADASSDSGSVDGGQVGGTLDGGCGASVAPAEDIVIVHQGAVRGKRTDAGVSFLGIPYVKPPVGALRWKAPEVDDACWSPAIREAQTYAEQCPQQPQDGNGFDASIPVEGNEDCLTLNVFKPSGGAPDGGWPVAVFIHGGGNTVGSAQETTPSGLRLYDGSRLAQRGSLVVVTLQYRLGVLGYLRIPDAGIVGNYGLQDQQAALQWVHRNIERFGGDTRRLMLFGESGGAVNTCAHLAMPGSRGLFTRALIQSGACSAPRNANDVAQEGTTWLGSTACAGSTDVAACLRTQTPESLIRAVPVPVLVGSRRPPVSWGPIVDETVLPTLPLEALRTGAAAPVPLIVGSNADETNVSMPRITTEAEYRAFVVGQLGTTIGEQALLQYPIARYVTPRRALVQLTSDANFTCPTRATARAAVKGMPSRLVYRYLFSRAPVPTLGAYHGLELLYVFQNVALATSTPMPADLDVERQMLEVWSFFAATGQSRWFPYQANERLNNIDEPPGNVDGWRTTECHFWDTVSGTTIPWP